MYLYTNKILKTIHTKKTVIKQPKIIFLFKKEYSFINNKINIITHKNVLCDWILTKYGSISSVLAKIEKIDFTKKNLIIKVVVIKI